MGFKMCIRDRYTSYSLYTLESNAAFSHAKATRELNYQPRPIKETLCDTARWLQEHQRIKNKLSLQSGSYTHLDVYKRQHSY